MATPKYTLAKSWNWFERSDDGLIKKPDPIGPYYDQDTPWSYSGYESIEQAEAALCEFFGRNYGRGVGRYMLVCQYDRVES